MKEFKVGDFVEVTYVDSYDESLELVKGMRGYIVEEASCGYVLVNFRNNELDISKCRSLKKEYDDILFCKALCVSQIINLKKNECNKIDILSEEDMRKMLVCLTNATYSTDCKDENDKLYELTWESMLKLSDVLGLDMDFETQIINIDTLEVADL